MSLGTGLSNAAYAVGTVLAVPLAQHYPQRRMMVGYAVLLVIGSILTAAAPSVELFIVGRVLQGLCTSLLLIAAVPPLALGYPVAKLKTTAMIMNMVIFGAVAAGPAIGGLQAQADAWRPLFWIVAGVAVLALVLAVLTFEDAPPADPDLAARPARPGTGRGRLRRRLLRLLAADQPRLPRPDRDRPAGRRPRRDRDPDRLPGDGAEPAADDPRDADLDDPGRRHRPGAARRRGLGLGDRADRRARSPTSTARCTSACSTCPSSAAR